MNDSGRYEPFIIGITGLSGSGKSWLVNHLISEFGNSVAVLMYDEYYRPFETQKKDANGFVNFDLPEALDSERCKQDLLQLIEGHPVLIQSYPFEIINPLPLEYWVPPAPIIVIEGLFFMHHMEIDRLLSARVFVEADRQNNLERRLKRDLEKRGISEEKSMYQWMHHVIPAYNSFILPLRDKCDIVIQNNTPEFEQIEQVRKLIYSKAHPSVLAFL